MKRNLIQFFLGIFASKKPKMAGESAVVVGKLSPMSSWMPDTLSIVSGELRGGMRGMSISNVSLVIGSVKVMRQGTHFLCWTDSGGTQSSYYNLCPELQRNTQILRGN